MQSPAAILMKQSRRTFPLGHCPSNGNESYVQKIN